MAAEDRGLKWQAIWEQRRQRCIRQDEVAGLRQRLPPRALAILDEARALASRADPLQHAAADVEGLVERVNQLEGWVAIALHGPVCNGLALLQCAAQELLAGAVEPPPGPPAAGGAGWARAPRGHRSGRFDWLLVVGDNAEIVELARECACALQPPLPVRVATTLEDARPQLGHRDGTGLVVTNLILPSGGGPCPDGLVVADEAWQHRHARLLVTAAGDYLDYWSSLMAVGLTGHDVVIKTRRDFADRLRRRLWEIARPAPLMMSYEEETGHLVWIGDVEVPRLEAQEALVLRFLDDVWKSARHIVKACEADTDLAPTAAGIPSLISTLRQKLGQALVGAESPRAQGEVIETWRVDGREAKYRLAPWLRWDEPSLPAGASRSLPPVLVVEDDLAWSDWVTDFLGVYGWPVSAATTADQAMAALRSGPPPIVVADLDLRDPATGLASPEVGLRLIEDVAEESQGAHVVVLSAFGYGDMMRSRLFEAGVRTVDVIHKASGRAECGAMLLTSLQRAADEMWRGVRRGHEEAPGHRLVRLERRRVEVDGVAVPILSPREASVLEELIRRPNQAVKAELIEARRFRSGVRSHATSGYNPLNKVHLAVRSLRGKIDRVIPGVGARVIRTPHRGARTAYELHGLVIDLVDDDGDG